MSKESSQKKHEFRYSGDLELSIGFEKSPLDKPSEDFRNADRWFDKLKKNVRYSIQGAPAPQVPAKTIPMQANPVKIQIVGNDNVDASRSTSPITKHGYEEGKMITIERQTSVLLNNQQIVGEIQLEKPFYMQSRMWLNSYIMFTSMMAFSLFSSKRFALPLTMLTVEAGTFYLFCFVFLFFASISYLVYFYFYSPSLRSFTYSHNLSKNGKIIFSEWLSIVVLSIFLIATLSDVRHRTAGCFGNGNVLEGDCKTINASLIFGMFSLFGILLGLVIKIRELKTVGLLKKNTFDF